MEVNISELIINYSPCPYPN